MAPLDRRGAAFPRRVNAEIAELGWPLRLEKLAGRGFGLVASRALPSGSVVALERPLVLSVSCAHTRTRCAFCLATPRAAEWELRCTCAALYFCSAACQRGAEASALHSAAECAALSSFLRTAARDPLADLVVQAIRILCHREAGRCVRPWDGSPLELGYSSYTERLCGFERSRRSEETLRRAARRALEAVPPSARVPLAELVAVLNHHQANVYGVLGPRAQEIALSSFVGLFQLFNHSCIPNLVFDCCPRPADGASEALSTTVPPRFALVTLRDIAAGEELCHCYAGSADSTSVRREYLLLHHGFECDCSRCAESDIGVEMDIAERLDGIRCRIPECGTGLGYQDWEPADDELHGLE
ncbi:hypothetical protein AB1Y20_016156 [Prymnesium parvum]|uniref:SET domain-containing protein n=1 Tax=Prymnesium parvum TaxID=97485 RepID=A0AB34K3H3_PRYPA